MISKFNPQLTTETRVIRTPNTGYHLDPIEDARFKYLIATFLEENMSKKSHNFLFCKGHGRLLFIDGFKIESKMNML